MWHVLLPVLLPALCPAPPKDLSLCVACAPSCPPPSPHACPSLQVCREYCDGPLSCLPLPEARHGECLGSRAAAAAAAAALNEAVMEMLQML